MRAWDGEPTSLSGGLAVQRRRGKPSNGEACRRLGARRPGHGVGTAGGSQAAEEENAGGR